MKKTEDKIVLREKLEKQLLKNPKFAPIVQAEIEKRAKLDRKETETDISNSLLETVQKSLGELSAITSPKAPSDLLIKNTESVYMIANALEVIMKSITDKGELQILLSQTSDFLAQMKEMKSELQAISEKKIDPPVVNVKASEVKIPDPVVIDKTNIVQETKFVERACTILEKILARQKAVSSVLIENSTPAEAVPVKLVTEDGKRFYNALTEILSAMSGGGRIVLQDEHGNKVNVTGNALDVHVIGDVELKAEDIEIGAVEIKNSTDDTRATVGANGLHVDVRASALPTGAATAAKQLPDGHKVDCNGSEVEVNNLPTEYPLPAGQIATLTPPAAITGFAKESGGVLDDISTDTGNIATSTDNIDDKIGEVQASPTANTVLGRLKDLLSEIVLKAGTNLIGKVSAGLDSASIYNGTTALTPKWAFANVSASQTDSSIVAAVALKKIRVLQAFVVAGGTATNLTFNSKGGGAGTAISPLLAHAANSGEILPFSPIGWFETVAGEALTVTTGAGSTTGIMVAYVEV